MSKKSKNQHEGRIIILYGSNLERGVITASKCHDILTKKTKVLKGGGGASICTPSIKKSGLTYTTPNIPALKYGRDMEDEAANDFFSAMKLKHKKPKMILCGLFLDKVSPVIGASPDRIFYCDCCPPACVEIKCPFSINYTSPLDSSISLPYVKNGVINPQHKYPVYGSDGRDRFMSHVVWFRWA